MALMKCKECGSEVSTSATACPKCGSPIVPAPNASRRIGKAVGLGCGGLVGVTILLIIVGTLMKPPATGATVSTGQAAAVAPAIVAPASKTDTLSFGKPTVKVQFGMTTVAVEVTASRDVKACTVAATFKKGDTIVGTANGGVNELAAGATKTVQMAGSDDVTGYETVKIEASTCF